MDILVSLLVAGGTIGLLDGLWLGLVAKDLYRSQVGHLMAERVDARAAAAFYGLYVVGVVVFAVMPAGNWLEALGFGGLLGLVAYGTYDLTNRATLAGFPWKIVVIDLAWGSGLTAVAAGLAYAVSTL